MDQVRVQKRNRNPAQKHLPPSTAPPKFRLAMDCPKCSHRAFTLSRYPQEALWIGLKCPNCRNIIHVRCTPAVAADEMHASGIGTQVLATEQRGQ